MQAQLEHRFQWEHQMHAGSMREIMQTPAHSQLIVKKSATTLKTWEDIGWIKDMERRIGLKG